MYENIHPNLALVLLFVRAEVEYGKGLLLKGEPVISHFQAVLNSISKRVLVYKFHLEVSLIYKTMNVQEKLISIWKAVLKDKQR